MGAGNVYIGGGFGHSKRATFNVSLATINSDVLASQSGTEVVIGTTKSTHYDILVAGAEATLATTYKAVGDKDKEISFIYKLNKDGTFDTVWKQVASTASAENTFSYEASSKTITFATSGQPKEGDKLVCAYTYETSADAQTITITSDAIPPVVKVTAYGIAKNVCGGKIFRSVLEGIAQVDGNWNFDLAADGEPVVQSLNMEFVKACDSNELYKFSIITKGEKE